MAKTKVVKAELIIGNAVGVTMAERAGESILHAALSHNPDVAVIVEADDIDIKSGKPIKGAEKYRLFHRPADSDKDGTLVAVRRDHVIVAGPKWTLASPDHLNGRHFDINPRWALTVGVKFYGVGPTRKITGVHFPPARSSALLPLAYKAMRELDDDLFAGDLNVTIAIIRRNFPAKDCRGKEVLHAVANPSMHLGAATTLELSVSDHPGVRVPFKVEKPV